MKEALDILDTEIYGLFTDKLKWMREQAAGCQCKTNNNPSSFHLHKITETIVAEMSVIHQQVQNATEVASLWNTKFKANQQDHTSSRNSLEKQKKSWYKYMNKVQMVKEDVLSHQFNAKTLLTRIKATTREKKLQEREHKLAYCQQVQRNKLTESQNMAEAELISKHLRELTTARQALCEIVTRAADQTQLLNTSKLSAVESEVRLQESQIHLANCQTQRDLTQHQISALTASSLELTKQFQKAKKVQERLARVIGDLPVQTELNNIAYARSLETLQVATRSFTSPSTKLTELENKEKLRNLQYQKKLQELVQTFQLSRQWVAFKLGIKLAVQCKKLKEECQLELNAYANELDADTQKELLVLERSLQKNVKKRGRSVRKKTESRTNYLAEEFLSLNPGAKENSDLFDSFFH